MCVRAGFELDAPAKYTALGARINSTWRGIGLGCEVWSAPVGVGERRLDRSGVWDHTSTDMHQKRFLIGV